MPVTGQFLRLVQARGSCRHYDAGRPVPREIIESCIEAARLAPSACNRQPWRFIIVDDAAKRRELCDTARLAGIPHPWWDEVPVFVALCARLDLITHRVAPAISGIPYYLLDVGIAGEHFVLAATEQGLGTCWIGWFSEKAVRKVLHIPRNVRVASLISLGYPADEPHAGPSGRVDATDITAWNAWGAT
ncbi:MAG: hypothetical protein A3K19_28635 [Lentisphaerae bacterium RIFOXYB12_FULL_65_16]|nr:MAG: hypothetical protein A3K18_28345 [Lentisphaerae bacterium RIFOXYA12_64_32]OGV92746.1 MAG: hypothetical protein A3K19_28635 [Lentisphaerae bacterium RIFOXYB12_FULL_65_16]